MIKGWKNNPEWVAYYEAKKEKKEKKLIDKANAQLDIEVNRARVEAALISSWWLA